MQPGVSLIVGVDWLRRSQIDLAARGDIEWLALLVSLGMLLFFASRLPHDDPPPTPEISTPATSIRHARRYGPVLAGP